MSKTDKHVKNITRNILTAINLAAIAALILTGYSDRIPAATHPLLSLAGLAFPLAAAANALFIAVWTIVRWRRVWLPVLGFIACYQPMWLYCPLNRAAADTADTTRTLRVMTFNVGSPWDRKDLRQIADYQRSADADICCLQEFTTNDDICREYTQDMRQAYPYHAHTVSAEALEVYSRHPIISHRPIHLNSRGNSAGIILIKLPADTLALIHCHLETTGFSREEKARIGSTVHGEGSMAEIRDESRTVAGKLMHANQIRALQADSVAWWAQHYQQRGMHVIVCGDFNDSPISYTHRTIARHLTDAYATAGRGPGYTYRQNGIRVRIDHILTSPRLQPVEAHVDHTPKFSDHYPLLTTLRIAAD